MEVAKFWDETLEDCESGLAARVIVIPDESISPYAREQLFDVATLLGLTPVATLVSEAEVAMTVASLLGAPMEAARELGVAVSREHLVLGNGTYEEATLGAIATSSALEGNHLRLVSRGELSLLLASVSSGVVICGERSAIASALARGLDDQIRELMGMDGRRHNPVDPVGTR